MKTGKIAGRPNDRGFGFIKIDGAKDGEKDLFFHSNELVNVAFADLREGDAVEFDEAESPKGKNAVKVSKI
jgi:CspA family cold shock protein